MNAIVDESAAETRALAQRRRFGMWLFLASLAMLFGGCLVGFIVIRSRAPEWPPAGSPALPPAFWLSTVLLAIVSGLLVLAERAAGSSRNARLTRLLTATSVLGIAFVLSQVSAWARLAAASELPQNSLYLFGVYVLSFLHVLHVIGGLIPLVWVTLRSKAGRYTATDHEAVIDVAMYWHFLGVVWLGILAVLAV